MTTSCPRISHALSPLAQRIAAGVAALALSACASEDGREETTGGAATSVATTATSTTGTSLTGSTSGSTASGSGSATTTDDGSSTSATDSSGGSSTTADPSGSTTATGSTSSTTSNTGSSTTEPGSTGSTTIRLDLGIPGTDSGTATDGTSNVCRKVDVVFAIDASGSMQGVVQDLQVAVNSWVQSLLNEVGEGGIDDFHLAVIDGCDQSPFFHDTNETSGSCGFSTGRNYMISSSANLGTEFTCVSNTRDSNWMGQPDTCSGDNDDENMATAASKAVSFPAATTENAGFLRDDAVLVVVAVTNEDEGSAGGFGTDTQEVYDRLIAAKNDPNNVVFIGIGGKPSLGLCFAYGETTVAARKLEELTGRFGDRGLFYNLCNENLADALDQALGLIDSACDEFVPPG
jgi:hypothetical protein